MFMSITCICLQVRFAGIEYATPVRTIHAIYNANHEDAQPSLGHFTQNCLIKEIETFYRELEDLISNAEPIIKENVDLLYFDDSNWNHCSKYR